MLGYQVEGGPVVDLGLGPTGPKAVWAWAAALRPIKTRRVPVETISQLIGVVAFQSATPAASVRSPGKKCSTAADAMRLNSRSCGRVRAEIAAARGRAKHATGRTYAA